MVSSSGLKHHGSKIFGFSYNSVTKKDHNKNNCILYLGQRK